MAALVAMAAESLSASEWRVVEKLRELRRTYPYFKLTLYSQGKHSALDMEWSPRVRLEEREAIDD